MSNETMRSNWTAGAAGWVGNERTFDALFSPVTDAIVDDASWSAGERALDVGCGSGTLLNRGVESGVQMTGVDISPGMVEAAQARVPDASVVLADAQYEDLSTLDGAPYHRLVSRFGVMFFADPGAAFANLRGAMDPGGRTAFACWRTSGENPIFTLGSSRLVDAIEKVSGPRVQPDGYTPGPTSFADPNFVRSMLDDAGWSSVDINALDFELDHGFDDTDGVEIRLTTVLSTTTGAEAQRVVRPALGERGWNDLLEVIRDDVRRAITGDTLRLPGAVWIVTASA